MKKMLDIKFIAENTDWVKKSLAKKGFKEEKVDELTREVRFHNDFARRVPVMEEQIKVINHRIQDIENADKRK